MPSKPQPLRTCTGCGEKKVKSELVRVVVDPSGRPVPDLKGGLPSRGAYVCPEGSCIKRAAAGRLAFSLGAGKGRGWSASDIRSSIAAAYRRRVLSLLGQARKSGRVISGTSMVEGELRRRNDETWLGLVAEDASAGITERIEKALEAASVPYRIFSDRMELGRAVGKSPRSRAADRSRPGCPVPSEAASAPCPLRPPARP